MEGGSFLHWIRIPFIFPILRDYPTILLTATLGGILVRVSFCFLNKEKAQKEKKGGKEETD